MALVLFGPKDWPSVGSGRVSLATVILALAYTVFSEWLNIEVRHAWAYRDIMPTLPWLGTGLAPLAQWIVVPLLALRFARRARG